MSKHGGGGGTGFHDKANAVNGNSSNIHVACQAKLSPLIVLCTIRSLIACEPVYHRKICKWSYVSGNLSDNRTLIAGGDDNSSIVSSAEISTEISTRGLSTSVGQGVSSCNNTNSAVISDSG